MNTKYESYSQRSLSPSPSLGFTREPPVQSASKENVERLAAIGQFATEIAHELNGPLDGVLRYINLTLRLLDRDQKDRSKECLLRGREGVLRIATIVGELLENARVQESDPTPVTLEQIITGAIALANAKPGRARIHVTLDFQDAILTTRQGDLFHVFGNIVNNAYDAMADGGRLAIACKVDDEGYCVIHFEDSGCGLPAGQEDRIFQGFFTTKKEGTGLGLAISKEIVERLKGHISASNNPIRGATLTLRIPLEAFT